MIYTACAIDRGIFVVTLYDEILVGRDATFVFLLLNYEPQIGHDPQTVQSQMTTAMTKLHKAVAAFSRIGAAEQTRIITKDQVTGMTAGVGVEVDDAAVATWISPSVQMATLVDGSSPASVGTPIQ